jgi:hypothetical protein
MPVGRKLPAKSGRQCCASSARRSGTIVPFRGFMGGTLVFPEDKLDLAGAVLADVFQKPAYPKEALAERYTNVLKIWRDKFAKEPLNQIQAAAIEVLLVDYPHPP